MSALDQPPSPRSARRRLPSFGLVGRAPALLAVAALGVAACSGSDDSTGSEGDSGLPSFCQPLLGIAPNDNGGVDLLGVTQANAETIVLLQSDAPDRFPEGMESVSEAARAIVDVDPAVIERLSADEAVSEAILFGLPDDERLAAVDPDLQEDARNMALFQRGVVSIDGTPAGDEFLKVLEQSCGAALENSEETPNVASTDSSGRQNTDRIPGSDEDDSVRGTAPTTPVTTYPPVGVAFDEALDGPFGSAIVSNVDMRIESAAWSNLRPDQYGVSGVEIDPTSENARLLYLTLDLDNQDLNDAVPLRDDQFTLVVGDNEYAAVEVSDAGGRTDGAEPGQQQTRTYGFDVGEVIDLSQAALEYRFEGLPGAFPVLAGGGAVEPASVDVGYPISLTPPTPLQYIGNRANNCDVPYTWTVDEATVSIDLPSPLALELPNRSIRSQPGTRWLRLTGAITTGAGTGSCAIPSGNVNNAFLQLVVDGSPVQPSGAPNVILEANSSVALDLYWPIPVGAGSVAIRAQARDGLTEEAPIAIPDLPPVDGD